MSSVHPTQVPGLVTDAGYTVMLQSYAAEPIVRNLIFRSVPLPVGTYGFTGKVIVGADEPADTRFGEPSHSRTFDEGYQWFGKVHKLQQHITLQEEMLRNPNAAAMITEMVGNAAGKFGQGFQRKKESIAAAMFKYGAYTAGHRDTFDGSYPGHADPYPAFIYDGKPLFAASGNGHPLYLDSSVTKYNKTANALSSTNLEAARILMTRTNAVDEANQPIRIDPDTLLVPPELEQTADILLGSTQAPGSANNDINTQRGRYSRITWRYLDDTDGWFLGAARQGLAFADSGDPMIETSAPDPVTGNVTVRFVSYCATWCDDWRPWSGHNISAS